MSQIVTVAELLRGGLALGEQVTVRGWLRSKRDSKAGISFLAVHDGSAFDPIQAAHACRTRPPAPYSLASDGR